MEQSSNKKIGISIAVVIILGLLATTLFAGKRDDDNAGTPTTDMVGTTPTPVTPPTTKLPIPPTTTPPIDTKKTVYKNGTYSATGTYMSPGGMDTVNVTLTLTNDIVTTVSMTADGDNTSKRYQQMFIAGYKQYVVGKNISTIGLTRVSGSSLTPLGFMDALTKIKAQAKA